MKKLFAIIFSLSLILAPIPSVNTAHAGQASGYLKIVLGMANGIVGTAIITKCQPTDGWLASPYIYLAGSLVYVAAEILGGKKKAKDVESNDKTNADFKDNMKEGGDYQKRAIDSQIENEKSNLSHISKKRKWMMATKVIYTVAMATSLFEAICSSVAPCKAFTGVAAGMTCNNAPSEKMISQAVVVAYQALTAYAAGGAMAAAAVAAMKLFGIQLGIGTSIVNGMINLMTNGYTRAAFFGAALALVMVIDSELKKEEDKAKKNIADLEKVKAQFDGADNSLAEGESTSGAGATAGSLGGNENDPTKKTYAIKGLAAGTQIAKHCYSNQSGSTEFSESGCKSPLKLIRPTFKGDMNIPTLVDGSNAAIDMANAVSNGDLASADVQADKLASMAGRVTALKDNLLAKANDSLAKQGKKPIDVKGTVKQQVDAFNAAMNKQSAGSGNLSMADFDAGEAATSETVKAEEIATPAVATVSAPVIEPVGGMDLSQIEGELGGTEVVDPNAANGKVATLEDSLGDFESNESDISTDPGVSIFKQVSNRYILNYEKIFQRKQINPPLAEPQPSN